MKKQTGIFIVVVIVILIVTGIGAFRRSGRMGKVDYLEHLNDDIFSVDGTGYKLRDMAFYIAYGESDVEDQAVIYNSENTNDYWNAHVNGKFIKLSAKRNAMDAAIHDVILYELALKDNMELNKEEWEFLEGRKSDFWSDLTEEQKERIGVSQDEINEVLDKMALAQKEQQFLAGSKGVAYEEFDLDGDAYRKLLSEHSYTINEDLWERVDFGNITLRH